MYQRRYSYLTLPFWGLVLFVVLISCNLPGKTATPTPGPGPAAKPDPGLSPAPPEPGTEPGLTRAKPFPYNQVVSIPGWKIQVLEIQRGGAAWQLMQTGGDTIPAPPAGEEYLTIKVSVQCMQIDDGSHSFGINEMFVTGDHLNVYQDKITDFPAPEFFYNDFYTAEKIDGWIDVLVPADEHNLILVFSPTYSDNADFTRYIALEDGASIPIPAEMAGIQPTDLGKDQANPAPFGAKTVSDDWETQILETVRGEAAWQALLEANPDIEPPAAGMEYLIAHVRLRYISSREGRASIYSDNFFSTGSRGEENWVPNVRLNQTPNRNWISSHFYHGLEVDGWTVLQVAIGETGTVIIFKPDLHAYGMPDNNIRYLLAQP